MVPRFAGGVTWLALCDCRSAFRGIISSSWRLGSLVAARVVLFALTVRNQHESQAMNEPNAKQSGSSSEPGTPPRDQGDR